MGNRLPHRAALLALLFAVPAMADQVNLADLGVDTVKQDWHTAQVDKSVDEHPLSIGGKGFDHGVGTHTTSIWWIDLGGRGDRFKAMVGVDDEVKSAAAEAARFGIAFSVVGDGKTLYKSGPMHLGDAAKPVDVDLHGIQKMILLVTPANGAITQGHADWADATIGYTGEKPTGSAAPVESAEILTPKPGPAPRINSAKIFGVHPTHPVLFTVAATGDRPMTFSADGLPAGVTIDPTTGRLSGAVAAAGDYAVTVHATNGKGTADGKLKIVVGDQIALTPPMGWNSWNCFASNVSQEKVQSAADAMVSSGLIDHGWTYVNVDDCWEIPANHPAAERRGPDGHVLTNAKFPDMKAMADYIHAKGLRAGLYSSPGPSTCGGYTASFQYEFEDAHQYAEWGFDYLKYDWCSYGDVAGLVKRNNNQGSDLWLLKRPYIVMDRALKAQDRDILFSLCQYGMGDVWKWGAQVGGNCWRTTDDINDSWGSMTANGFHEAGHEQYGGPGHWNDPDMLVVGSVGWGPDLHPTRLTPNEQYTHISLWCLLSSPLLIGCDMTKMDPFTLSLLTNDEVIAINQDPLGKQAGRVSRDDEGHEVWAKDLEDGSKAIGLFNRGEFPATVTVKFEDLKVSGSQIVRDLWRQKDVGTMTDEYSVEVPRHGVVLVRLIPAK
jgi:alpha-galactosidase